MARTRPQHKENYDSFITPGYRLVPQVDAPAVATQFQAFLDACMTQVPDEGKPADGYLYNTHMGAFCRSLDEAHDHFTKGLLAFYAKRGSGTSTD